MPDNVILAAGAVIIRKVNREPEYLVIHRSYRDDWTFPKGKLDPGEHLLGAAVREVREETGFVVQLSVGLPTQVYSVKQATKHSHYWLAHIIGGSFAPNREVDEIKWCSFEQAQALLTYEHDIEVLNAAQAANFSAPLIVLRHAQATKRAEWAQIQSGKKAGDPSRPLTAVGRSQAINIATALAAYGVSQIFTSDSRRCEETVGPYAGIRSLPLQLEPHLSEEGFVNKPNQISKRFSQFALEGAPLVICSHRPVMPAIMETLRDLYSDFDAQKNDFSPSLSPGSFVVFHRNASELSKLIQIERHLR